MLISIITASYNYENYIKEAIQSVLDQTYQDWELIIVDDGSKDNSVEVIKSYCEKDSRIKLYQHEGGINKGLAETLKLGISKVKGDWIAFLESDDKFTPDCLEEKVKAAEKNPKAKFIFSDYEMFGDADEVNNMKWYRDTCKKIFKKSFFKYLSRNLMEQNYIATFSIVMLKKELLENLDWNSPSRPSLDYYLWVQIAPRNKFYYINKKLTYWRMHQRSYIHDDEYTSAEDKKIFKDKILEFCSKNIFCKPRFYLIKLKQLRKSLICVRLGRKARLVVLGKIIYEKQQP